MKDLISLLTDLENQPHQFVGDPDLLQKHINDPEEIGFGSALYAIQVLMQADEYLQTVYQSNIAMRLYDTTRLSKKKSNEAAGQIMDLLFLRQWGPLNEN